MPSRRRQRVAMLNANEVQAIEREARLLFDAIRKALTKLVPFNESYSALYKLGDEMRVALNVIAGRPRDHVEPIVGPAAMPGSDVTANSSCDGKTPLATTRGAD